MEIASFLSAFCSSNLNSSLLKIHTLKVIIRENISTSVRVLDGMLTIRAARWPVELVTPGILNK